MRVIILPLALFLNTAFGEYRVYQYLVHADNDPRNPDGQVVTSTLDPVAYLSYHALEKGISLDLLNSWLCVGVTTNKPLCNAPAINPPEEKKP